MLFHIKSFTVPGRPKEMVRLRTFAFSCWACPDFAHAVACLIRVIKLRVLPLITMYIFTRCFPRCAVCVVDCGMKIVLRIVFHDVNSVSGDGGEARGIAHGKNFPSCEAGLGTLDEGARSRRTVLKLRSNHAAHLGMLLKRRGASWKIFQSRGASRGATGVFERFKMCPVQTATHH